MTKYYVTLKPIGSYFFGGENTFGDGKNQHYSVVSRDLPQVSAIMGIVRYAVLAFYDKLDGKADNKDQATYIGTHSFRLEGSAGYGHIKSISPVFISKTCQNGANEILTLMPCFRNKKTKELTPISKCKFVPIENAKIDYFSTPNISGGNSSSTGRSGIIVDVAGKYFNFKDFDIESHWVDGSGKTYLNIIIDDERVGIHKQTGVPDNDKGYFIKKAKRLSRDCRFCFNVSVSEDLPNLRPLYVNLGGDRSLFKMEFVKCSEDDDVINSFCGISMGGNCLLLLSDAYLSSAELDSFDYVCGESEMNRYTSNAHKWKRENKTVLYRLLSRGSVIVHHDPTTLDKLRWKSPALKKMDIHDAGLNIMINCEFDKKG